MPSVVDVSADQVFHCAVTQNCFSYSIDCFEYRVIRFIYSPSYSWHKIQIPLIWGNNYTFTFVHWTFSMHSLFFTHFPRLFLWKLYSWLEFQMKLHKIQQCLAMQNAFVLMDPAVGPVELKSLSQTCTYFSTISSKHNGPVGKNSKFHFVHSNQVTLSQLSGRWADVSRNSRGPLPQPTITSKGGLKKHWGSNRMSHIIKAFKLFEHFPKNTQQFKWKNLMRCQGDESRLYYCQNENLRW